MQDKLYKILKVKIDSINRNIDNLNYLNGELEKNTNDLNYIQEKIDLFGASNVLAFDNLSRDEFEKILLMLDPRVSEVFQDKTCNYQGIMYIIQGIKQGISLELTDIQERAIQTFIQEMINKKSSLEDTIYNLNESKKRLPEVDMSVLNGELKKYQTIISKLEENLYIIEIDDVIGALEFASTPIEEKISIFEFILKYNASIYAANQTSVEDIKAEDDYSLNEIDVPEFHYEPINIYDDIKAKDEKMESPKLNVEESDKVIQIPKEETDYSFPAFPDFTKNEKIVEVSPEIELPELPKVEIHESAPIEIATPTTNEVPLEINPDLPIVDIKPNLEFSEADKAEPTMDNSKEDDVPPFEVPVAHEIETPPTLAPEAIEEDLPMPEMPVAPVSTPEISLSDIDNSTSTAELEDIIGKIDAKLKEMEIDNKSQVKSAPLPEPKPEEVVDNKELEGVKSALSNAGINAEAIENIDILTEQNVTNTLNILKSENLLGEFKSNMPLLSKTLNVESTEIKLVINAIKEAFGKKEYREVIGMMVQTMPALFASVKVMEDFLKNISFYKEHKIDLINLFDNYRELLIINNQDLENNYNLTKNYKIELTDDNVKYLLGNKRVLENLDYYIEAKGAEKSGLLGREEDFNGIEYIKKNPYKLNNITGEALMKLRYATENGQKIYGNKPGILAGEITNPKVDVLKLPIEYRNQYFDKEYTFTSTDEVLKLSQEIKNKKDFDMSISENIQKLDNKYKKDELKYVINGLTFSRLKTIRLYNFLVTKKMPVKEAILMALTYNSIIKKDEYLNLETAITSLLEGGN